MRDNPAFIACRPLLSGEEKQEFRALAESYPIERFNSETRNIEEMSVDFVYTSAKIEGNTYETSAKGHRIEIESVGRR